MSTTQVLTRSRSRHSNIDAAPQSAPHINEDSASLTASAGALLDPEYQDRRNLKLSVRLVETIRHYCDLGFTAFGGPGVHVVILRKRFVDHLKWLDETTFADLFSLGNALPGPGSTQLAFSIAVARNGTLAGLIAFLFWSLPGAAGMAALGAGVRSFPDRLPPIVLALLTGLNAAAVGLIALAAYQLSMSSITDPVTRLLVLASASFGICYHAPWMYPVLVFGGGLITLIYDFRRRIASFVSTKLEISRRRSQAVSRGDDTAQNESTQDIELEPVTTAGRASLDAADKKQSGSAVQELPFQAGSSSIPVSIRQRTAQTVDRNTATPQNANDPTAATTDHRTPIMVLNRTIAVALGVGFLVFVIAVVVTRSQLASPPRMLDFFTNMVIAGVIIFGGGPVVIPLLRGYTVENGWVESRDFLLGFAILQAFPGPNFNFAAYLGVLAVPQNPALGAFLGWLGIFSPGLLLKLSLLPIYNTWRKHEVAKSVLRGLNASATGLVYTAVWQLFLVGYIYTPARGVVVESTSQSGPLTSDPFWCVVASSAFVATQWFKSPPAVTIVAGAVAGLAWFGVVGAAGTERQQAFF
ncbi:Chromate transporter [Kalmanozyma brasiliensis GHG001]|uniref:Chromate transporter n=1 Tax=Kalmanozyma brasiliensis (strain GHG001) TaxID=1365824 RepID=V5ESC6_KALBG|nr:Chromate transporter [Kalmanozyma brasiliensis GHG001]EST04804.1 Chromate transporter [Kalmanozyma brasiliensis GHG001]